MVEKLVDPSGQAGYRADVESPAMMVRVADGERVPAVGLKLEDLSRLQKLR